MSKRPGTSTSHWHLAVLVLVLGFLWWILPGTFGTGVEAVPAVDVDSIPDWERLLNAADSLALRRDFDSAIVLGREALNQVEQTRHSEDTLTASVLYKLGYYCYRGIEAYHKARHKYTAEHQEAESTLKRACAIRSRQLGPEHPEVANCRIVLADLYNFQGHHEQAEELYHQILASWRQAYGSQDERVSLAMGRLGQVLKNRGEYAQSELYYDSSLSILIEIVGPDSRGIEGAIRDLALLYYHQGRYEESINHYLWALDNLETNFGPNSERVAFCLYNMERVYRAQGNYAEGERICRRVLRIWQEIDGIESMRAAKCLTTLADLCRHQGNYAEAEKLILQAETIHREILTSEHPDFGYTLASKAALYKAQGKYPEAVPLYREALEIFGNTMWEDNPRQAEVLQDLAAIYLYHGKNHDAELALDTAISIMTRVFSNRRSKRTGPMMDMSRAYESQGRYSDAESICREVLEILAEEFGRQHQVVAECHDRLAEVYRHQGKYSEAEGQYVRALAIRLRTFGPDHQETARTRGDLARLFYDEGSQVRAEQAYLQALEGYRKSLGKTHPDYAACQRGLALVYYELGRYDESITLLESSAEINQRCFGPEYPDYAETIRTLAEVCGNGGDFESCIRYYREFLDLREAFLEYVFANSSDDQKLMWIDKFPLLDDALLSVALDQKTAGFSELALEMDLKGKGKVIDALMAEKELALCSVDPDLERMVDRHREITTLIANAVIAHTVGTDQPWRPDSLRTLQRERDSLEAELSRHCSEFRDDLGIRRFELTDVASALPPDAVLWEVLRYVPHIPGRKKSDRHGEPRYAGMVLRSEGQIALVDLGDVKTLESLVDRCRQRIYKSYSDVYTSEASWSEDQLKRATAGLYERLFAPMIACSGNSTEILASFDGSLNLIPLEILPTPDDGYVLEKYRISYLSSGKDLLRYSGERAAAGDAVVIADPDFDIDLAATGDILQISTSKGNGRVSGTPEEEQRGYPGCSSGDFTRLSWTAEEAALISDIITHRGGIMVQRYTGRQATEQTVKDLGRAPRILHLATHGFFCSRESLPGEVADNNPLLRSGLALAGANRVAQSKPIDAWFGEDGILTAYEVSGLNLVGTELATLSACETGLGEVVSGEGVFGMRRAFQHAGSESILMSLWRVPDKATTALMGGFYTRWLEGTPKADALRQSALHQLQQLRRERGHGHPLMWGGFVLAGNPN